MGQFTRISADTFKELQINAGVLLNTFNPASPAMEDEHIICATTGGITANCVPTITDWFEDVDNAPNNTKEGMRIDGYDCSLAFTALNATAEAIRMSLGAADITADSGAIKPRMELKDTDFSDVWWVGDRSDGGLVAIKLINALSTAGFSLKTTKNGKGNLSVTLGGHVSIADPDKVPMEFYVSEGT